jgi:hypothetical protein
VKSLEERMKAAKAELNARGVDRAEGERFNVTKSETVRWSLDTAAAKEALGEAWVTAHSKLSPVTTFRITVRRAALALRPRLGVRLESWMIWKNVCRPT